MEKIKLPSEHQVGDRVNVEFRADHLIKGEIMAVRFTDAYIFYDIALFIINDDDSFPIRDVPAEFVKSSERPIEAIHDLIHDACFELSQGRIDNAQNMLSKADKLAHDLY